MPTLPIEVAPGVMTEETDRGAVGRYKDCDNVRFRQGLPEKLGGWLKRMIVDEDGNPAAYEGVARARHDWASLDNQFWTAIGTHRRVYLLNNDVLYNITPLQSNGILTDPFTTTNASQIVRVTHPGHNIRDGNYVVFSDADPVGGLDLNGEYVVTQVIDDDEYEFDAGAAATSSATGGGTVTFEYELDIGSEINTTIQGYGTGTYGTGPYGIGSQTGGVRERARVWSLDNFGEDLLLSPRGGALYHWDRTSGPDARATLVENAPATMERMLVSPESRHVIALGAGTGSALSPGDPDPLLIRFSDREDFNDWIPSSTNLAGDLRLDKGSEILTGVESRGDVLVSTDQSMHAFQNVGGLIVFGQRHLGTSVALAGPNAAADVNGVWYGMGKDDFIMYDGVIRVMNCDVRNRVFDDFNDGQGDIVYAGVNTLFTEVWWLYPSAASTVCDRYVKYNYKDQVWDFGVIGGTAWGDQTPAFDQRPYRLNNGNLFVHETAVDGDDDAGVAQPIVSFLRTWDFEAPVDEGSRLIQIRDWIPDFKELVGSVEFTVTGRGYPQRSATVVRGPVSVTANTEELNLRIKSRQVSYEVRSLALGDDWRMGTWRVQGRPRGRRGS